MPEFSRFNVLLRRFPSNPPVGATMRRSAWRPSLTGTPYKPMDRLACWTIVATALLVGCALFVIDGVSALPWVLVAGPASVGVACLLAKMVERVWFSRVVAATYVALCLAGLLAYAAGT